MIMKLSKEMTKKLLTERKGCGVRNPNRGNTQPNEGVWPGYRVNRDGSVVTGANWGDGYCGAIGPFSGGLYLCVSCARKAGIVW